MTTRYFAMVLSIFMLFSGSARARDDGGKKYEAPPEIIAALPKYCWWWYMDNVPYNEEYSIQHCQGGTNHFCPGLVSMKQAEREKDLPRRIRLWENARGDMEYTISHTDAECWLQPRAKLNITRINMELDTLKLQLRMRKR